MLTLERDTLVSTELVRLVGSALAAPAPAAARAGAVGDRARRA
jgi:hypothetical protein